jgi:tetratricopeptide (TPR) repeat protein
VRDRDHGLCLTDETLIEYLEGNLEPAIRAASEVHLVSCETCRDQLAFFMHMLQPDVSSEEASALQAITAEWDRRGTNERTPTRGFKGTRSLRAFTAVAAVLVVGLVSVWIIRERSVEPKSATEVVQVLLQKNRPFEGRMAGQSHLPIVRIRGTDDTGVSYGLLAGEMTRMRANSHEMGRFYLLQKDFTRAISYLEIAEREVGASAAVHNDLAVAYLEGGSGARLEKAQVELLHALWADRSFAPAVFNLALFYERTNATALAEAQWKRYLELDSDSNWAKEARGRLQGLSR